MKLPDYTLIMGLPGTGKSTLIYKIIEGLLKIGQTIVISSHTHVAVDTILLKLHEQPIKEAKIIRLGQTERVQSKLISYNLDYLKQQLNFNEYINLLNECNIIFTTCMNINHPIFEKRKFDICILDEATQISLPLSLGVLQTCKRFLLVGDTFQLPPLTRSNQAKKGGFEKSLFHILAERNNEEIIQLKYQYRMNWDIMNLSNYLIYNNLLCCDNELVKNQQILLNEFQLNELLNLNSKLIQKCFLPSTSVLFLNFQLIFYNNNLKLIKKTLNFKECQLILKLINYSIQFKINLNQILILSPYKDQTILIQNHLLKNLNLKINQLPKIATIDKVQGIEADIVILSLVYWDSSLNNNHNLLKDWRRLNVALTRAKKKLLILGCELALNQFEKFQQLFNFCKHMNWWYDVDLNDLK